VTHGVPLTLLLPREKKRCLISLSTQNASAKLENISSFAQHEVACWKDNYESGVAKLLVESGMIWRFPLESPLDDRSLPGSGRNWDRLTRDTPPSGEDKKGTFSAGEIFSHALLVFFP